MVGGFAKARGKCGAAGRWLAGVAGALALAGAASAAFAQTSAADAAHIAHIEAGLVSAPGGPPTRTPLTQRMAELHVREGVSIAYIHDGQIAWARGFGVTRIGGPPVTPETLFLAGSLRSALTATVVLNLSQFGRIDLNRVDDRDIDLGDLRLGRLDPPITVGFVLRDSDSGDKELRRILGRVHRPALRPVDARYRVGPARHGPHVRRTADSPGRLWTPHRRMVSEGEVLPGRRAHRSCPRSSFGPRPRIWRAGSSLFSARWPASPTSCCFAPPRTR